MYIALQNENGVSCLTIIVNKIQLAMSYDERNRTRHTLQASILKTVVNSVKLFSITVLSAELITSQ
jgi:hypothetical protein